MKPFLCLTIAFVVAGSASGQAGQSGGAIVRPQIQGGPNRPARRPGMPPRDAGPVPTGTARLRGRVTAGDTGAPLRRAQVRLTAAQIAYMRAATTDANGYYEFTELPAGRYNLTATKAGYVSLQYGQQRPFEPGRPLEIAAAQAVDRVDLTLPRGGVVTGRITDEYGEPMAQVQLQAMRYQYMPGGQKRLVPSAPGQFMTDDLGQYRMYGLMPGEYIVSATHRQPMMAMPGGPATSPDANEGYAPTYYPGTASEAEAQTLSVGAGEEVAAHFALQSTRLSRISGVVVTSQGRAADGGGMIMLRSAAGIGMTSMIGGQIGPDGSFTLTNVPPGQHNLDVRLGGRGPGSQPEFASVPVTADSGDINNIVVRTGTGATIGGRVVFEGTSPRTGGMAPTRVFASQASPSAMGGGFGMGMDDGSIADDGTFQLRGAAGSVLLRVATPPTWTLKSVTVAGEDITDTPLELSNEDVKGVTIVLTDRLTEVSGTVKDSQRRAVHDYVVVLFPETLKDGVTQGRFVRSARPDQEGRFVVRGMPPGDYYAAAVESLEQGREWDPALHAMLRNSAKRITLRDGQTVGVDLDLALAP